VTIFQKILDREVPAQIVLETDDVLAFRDIHPQAPVHVLVIPKDPIARISYAMPEDGPLLGKLLLAAAQVARDLGVEDTGYRLVINNGDHGGQSVEHVHVHLLAGQALGWPPFPA
jgi:histidine triad (HIT) family protein